MDLGLICHAKYIPYSFNKKVKQIIFLKSELSNLVVN